MDYQNYEEYMRNVLGYSPMTNNLYANQMPDYEYNYNYNMPPIQQPVNVDYLNQFYPEIYKMIYPMVCKLCNKNQNREITKDILENMVNEIYENVEPPERNTVVQNQPLRNGDVRNPNAKEMENRQEVRQPNFLLRDLITILLLRELGRAPFFRPPIKPPIPGPGPRPPFYMRNYY